MQTQTYKILGALASARMAAWKKSVGILNCGSVYFVKYDDSDLYSSGANLVAEVVPGIKIDEWTNDDTAYVIVHDDTFGPKKYRSADLEMIIDLDTNFELPDDLADAVYLGFLKMEELEDMDKATRKGFDSRMEDLLENSGHEIANPEWAPADRTMGITKESLKL